MANQIAAGDVSSNEMNFGVAFSGGGIRSAAFCSGVLRRLIRYDKEPDVLSCVSGGGYTGSAYVQWKFRQGKRKQTKEWSNDFFNNMKDNVGVFCNWSNGFGTGCCDSLFLLIVILFVFLFSCIIILAFAFPTASLVNLMYGRFLNGTRCSTDANSMDCKKRKWLFLGSFFIFVFFHAVEIILNWLKNCYPTLQRAPMLFLRLGQLISGNTFAFTFFPWFIDDFIKYKTWYEITVIIFVTGAFWFFVPVIRRYSSLVLLIYIYSYVVYWHVYKEVLLTWKYTDKRFRAIMVASVCILAVLSIFGDLKQRTVYLYNRWRLQKAFYKAEKKCISYDCFPGGHCWCCFDCPPTVDNNANSCGDNDGDNDADNIADNHTHRAATLGDLEQLTNGKPLYISNVVANNWCESYETRRKYCLLTMSSKGISVIEEPQQNSREGRNVEENFIKRCLNDDNFINKLKPNDITIASAMAMSAAAMSPYLGKNKEIERQFSHFLTVFGIEMAAQIVYEMTRERGNTLKDKLGQVLLYVANFVVFLLILGVGLYAVCRPSFPSSPLPVRTTVICVGCTLLACLLLPFIVAGLRTKVPDEYTQKFSQLERWCVVHLPIYRFFRSILSIITHGETPPAMLHLSDGGHFENSGMLPLLKLRLQKILIVHGAEMKSNEDYAKDIIVGMDHARKMFNCSFVSMGGDDVLTAIQNEFVRPNDNAPRKFEFKVRYSDSKEGHITLVAPRPPTDSQANRNEDLGILEGIVRQGELAEWEYEGWGSRATLTAEDVRDIEGCPNGIGCCECCHLFSGPRCNCCLKFPRHPTINQFYTPKMFIAYHKEGYKACQECDDFLGITIE